MKTAKFFGMLLAAFTLSLGFTACGDDDEDVPTPSDNKYAELVVGTWKVEEWSKNNSTDDGYVNFTEVFYTFASDGKAETLSRSRIEENRSWADSKGYWSENVGYTYGTYTITGHTLHMLFNHAKGEYRDHSRFPNEDGTYEWKDTSSPYDNKEYSEDLSVVIVSIDDKQMVIEAVASDPQWQGRKETLHLTRTK